MKINKRNKRVCNSCGEQMVVPLVYGEPSQELLLKAEKGKIFLGGCVFGENTYSHACLACGRYQHTKGLK